MLRPAARTDLAELVVLALDLGVELAGAATDAEQVGAGPVDQDDDVGGSDCRHRMTGRRCGTPPHVASSLGLTAGPCSTCRIRSTPPMTARQSPSIWASGTIRSISSRRASGTPRSSRSRRAVFQRCCASGPAFSTALSVLRYSERNGPAPETS